MDVISTRHRRALRCMCASGMVSAQDMNSVYTRLSHMPGCDREAYLKQVIRNSLRTVTAKGEALGGALRKKSRNVTGLGRDILMVLDSMADVMYGRDGIGLAANQIGVLRRLVVIDTGDGLLKLVNPAITASSGEQTGGEGCLSIPEISGVVIRPEKVTVIAYNEKGDMLEINGEGLLARVLCHEIDHLDGVLFIDKAESGTLERISKKRHNLC